MKKTILIIAAMLMLISCATSVPKPAVPEIPNDDAFLDELIEEPKTSSDLLHNMTVMEYMYVNSKLQTFRLAEYIAKLADDKESEKAYRMKIAYIEAEYGLNNSQQLYTKK